MRPLKILRDHRFQIDRLISEPDRGIYDAMMKGVQFARGDWVIFLGAGDRFAHDWVLAQFRPRPDTHMVYGSFYWEAPERCVHVQTKPLEELWKGIRFSHQSLFCRREVLLELGFSLSLSIAADYDFYVRALASGYRIEDLGRPISIVRAGGLSDRQFYRRTIERFTVVVRKVEQFLWREALIELYKRYLGFEVDAMFYEDLVADTRGELARVGRRLGVGMDAPCSVYKKMTKDDLREAVVNYDELVDSISSSKAAFLLSDAIQETAVIDDILSLKRATLRSFYARAKELGALFEDFEYVGRLEDAMA